MMEKGTVKRRIFISNTIMVLVTLIIFLLINVFVIKVYSEIIEKEFRASMAQVKNINEIEDLLKGFTVHRNDFFLIFGIDGILCIAILVIISQFFTKKLTDHIMAPLDALADGVKRIRDNELTQDIEYTGEIEFENESLMKVPAYKLVTKGITLTPEGRHLFPELTVKENLMLGAYSTKDKSNYEWILELFPRLKERLNQYAGTMSGGEQQQCAIARALMSNPKFLMLDEPSLGLAPNIVDTVFDIIKKINKERGITIVIVEQNANIALNAADRGYVLENGVIRMSGEAKEMLASSEIQKLYLGL